MKKTYPSVIRNPISAFSFFMLVIIMIASFSAPLLTKKGLLSNPTELDLDNSLEPWFSRQHLLGTDRLGRDILARALYAGRTSLTIGFVVMVIQLVIGVSLGLLAGYYGSWLDDVVNFILQVTRGIPTMYLLLTLSVLFRPDPLGLAGILGILGWTNTCRQIRALVFSAKNRNYVDAARSIGATDARIISRHILPNLSSITFVIAGFDITSAILTEASLSFLGFGVQPPVPSWGNMLSGGLERVATAPWLVVTPGLFIATTVFSVFVITDELRDFLDPRLGS